MTGWSVLNGKTEYAVLCPSDGKLRSTSDSFEQATERALARDTDCGCCRPKHGKHTAVMRECSPWTIAKQE